MDRILLCLGLGYTARVLGSRLLAEGWRVIGSSRSEDGAARLRGQGFEAFVLDTATARPDALPAATHILSSVPPGEEGDPLPTLLAAARPRLQPAWIGYLSTTGVYGDAGGGWVDEDTPPRPLEARSVRRVEAERAWLDLWRDHGLPVHVFRLAGIYGPGRGAIEQLRAGQGRRVVRPGHVFSRIHVEDAATILRASMDAPRPGRIYNLADDEPASQSEVTAFAADLLGMEPPPEIPFEEAELSPMARGFWNGCRRVANNRVKEELRVALAYPTYRDGLRACLEWNQPAGRATLPSSSRGGR